MDRLRAAERESLERTIDEVSVAGVQMFFRLAGATADLLEHASVAAALAPEQPFDSRIHARVRERLEPLDPIAADELREAYEWLRAILAGFVEQFRTELAIASKTVAHVPQLTADEVRSELRGPSGSFLRGMLLTIAAVEVVLAEDALPSTISRWCDLALRENQAAANAFRAQGIRIPTAIAIPGMTPAQWRRRRSSSRLRPGVLPPGVEERIVDAFDPDEIWLFGSRAEGTHGPASDWDLLVVVPDHAVLADDAAETLASLRRERVEVFLARRSEFEDGKRAFGSLANIAVTQGYSIRGR